MKKQVLVCGIIAVLFACATGCDKVAKNPVQEVAAAPTATSTAKPTAMPVAKPLPTVAPTPKPTPEPTPEPTPTPSPAPDNTSLPIIIPDNIQSPYKDVYQPVEGELSNKTNGWGLKTNSAHQPTMAYTPFDIRQYDGYYLGDINSREIYLTFDQGYENGFTAQILDVLAEKGVKATFFLTKHYISSRPDLVQRIVDEGHMAANHTLNHHSLPDCTDEEIADEIIGLENMFTELTGQEMLKFMRPPSGEYSARSLAVTQSLGYKSIFWSYAYMDWDVNNQPDPSDTYKLVMNNLHNGEIILLHSVSSANASAMSDIIDGILANGYEFKTIQEMKLGELE